MKRFIIIQFVFSTLLGYSQNDCFFIDNKTNLARNKVDSTLYSGDCNKFFKNGKKEFTCFFENGIIKSSKTWNKNGILLDSTIYIDGETKFLMFRFFSNKRIADKCIYVFKEDKETFLNGTIHDYVIDGKYISYFKNGKIKFESNYNNGVLEDTMKYYYENGNLNEIRIYKQGKLINPVYEWDKKGNEFEVIYIINNKGEGNVEESRTMKDKKK